MNSWFLTYSEIFSADCIYVLVDSSTPPAGCKACGREYAVTEGCN